MSASVVSKRRQHATRNAVGQTEETIPKDDHGYAQGEKPSTPRPPQ